PYRWPPGLTCAVGALSSLQPGAVARAQLDHLPFVETRRLRVKASVFDSARLRCLQFTDQNARKGTEAEPFGDHGRDPLLLQRGRRDAADRRRQHTAVIVSERSDHLRQQTLIGSRLEERGGAGDRKSVV